MPVPAPMPLSAVHATTYRAQRWWDDRSLADGVEAAAVQRPSALAVADNERSLTCVELAASVAAGVSTLQTRGVGNRDAVVLITGNTLSGVVAYHSLLRVGATVLLLDRRCGAADVRHATEQLPAPVRVVVAADERDRLLGGRGLTGPVAETVDLSSFGSPITSSSPPAPAWREQDRDEPAVVLFTSGTTGRPKGVVHSLNTLTAGARNMATIMGATPDDALFLVSPLASITGVMQMHLAADRHVALVLEDRFDPDLSLDRINRVEATLLGGAPVIAERLLRAAQARASRIAIRTMALGGAMLPRPLLETATDSFGIQIARVYGSSEAPNFSGSIPSDPRERRLADDGMLLPGNEVRIGSSAHSQEGTLRGPCLFLGYLDPADHAAAFEDGWFRTGDLIEANGDRITVVGRIKEVVNRNGLKISLHEIDAALTGLLNAVEYASFGVPDIETGERLAVAVLPMAGASLNLDDVVEHLTAQGTARRNLPEELVLWDGPLPRTASGKVVRSRLVMDAAAKRSVRAPRLVSRSADQPPS